MTVDNRFLHSEPVLEPLCNGSGSVVIDEVFCSCPIVRFLTDTCLKQASPAEAAFQPLSHYSVALNVSTQLLGGEPVPATLRWIVPTV